MGSIHVRYQTCILQPLLKHIDVCITVHHAVLLFA